MHVTYGFIYYFIVLLVIISAMLPLLLARPARRTILRLTMCFDLPENHILLTIVYFICSLLMAVMVDSIWSFWSFVQETDFGTLPMI